MNSSAPLSGHFVDHLYRYGLSCLCSGGHSKINGLSLLGCDGKTVYCPGYAASHVKGYGHIPSPDAVKDFSWNGGGSIHINMNGVALFCCICLSLYDLPAFLAVLSLNKGLSGLFLFAVL